MKCKNATANMKFNTESNAFNIPRDKEKGNNSTKTIYRTTTAYDQNEKEK